MMDIDVLIKIVTALGIVGLFSLAGLIFKRYGYTFVAAWAQKTRWKADDVIVAVLRRHVFLWCLLLGFYFAGALLFTQEGRVYIHRIIVVGFIISLSFAVAKITSGLIRAYSHKMQTTVAVSGLTQSISRTAIFVIGALMILHSLGISITPLLTTLGIGGLAVALALQDTLSNLFAGFHIILAKQVKIGDYIQLETGQEGYVEDINWRTTKIRMLPHNIVLIPNSKLAQIIVTNFYLPQKEMSVLIDVGVHYESDLEKVEKVTMEVAREVVREVEGAVPGFEPFMRYHTFGDFSINFTMYLRAREFFDQYRVRHEFVKRLHRRYTQEGIVIPFPITALNVTQEGAQAYLKR